MVNAEYRWPVSVDVPLPLRGVVRADEGGWRLRVAPDGVSGVLRRVLWVLVMMSAVAMFVLSLALGMSLFIVPDPAGGPWTPRIVLTVVLTGPLGLLHMYWAVRLFVTAVRSAVAFHRVDLRPVIAPTQIVLSGWLRRAEVDVADLSQVLVRQRRSGLDIVLRTTAKTVVCKANSLTRVVPEVLTAWLGEILAPAEIPVRHVDGTRG